MNRIICMVVAIFMATTVFAIPVQPAFATNEDEASAVQNEALTVQDEALTVQDEAAAENLIDAVIDADDVTLENAAFTYTGNAIEPKVTVNNGETVLGQDVDYTLEYDNNINAGTAVVKITGIGEYTGTVEKTFEIEKASFSNVKVSISKSDYSYTGSQVKPTVTVKFNGTTVSQDNYAVKYSNNRYPGTATITVTGKGNFTNSSIKKSFYIARVDSYSIKTRKTESLKFSWEYQKNVDGYIIYKWNSSTKSWKAIKNVKGAKNNIYTVSGLTPGMTHKFRVKAYEKASSKVYYSAAGDTFTTATRPSKASITKVSTFANETARITWNKRNGDGYQIQYSRNKDFSKSKTVTVKGYSQNTKLLEKLYGDNKYYVRVRALKNVNNKTKTYGAWSAVKTFKAKDTGWITLSGTRYYYVNGERAKGYYTIKGNQYYFSKSTGAALGVSWNMWEKVRNSSSDTKYLIAVSKSKRRVCVYTGEKGDWKLKYYWKCTVGAPGTPTPSGSYKVPKSTVRYPNKQVMFGWKEGYSCWYSTKITGPYLFHSVLYQPRSKTVLQDGRLGYALSHGCIRLALDNAYWIYKNINTGTRVIIY